MPASNEQHDTLGSMKSVQLNSKISFKERVHRVVQDIPAGKTMSYGEVARKAGSPGAARAVGTLLSKNFDPSIPCHRVIRSNGTFGEYNRGSREKAEILLRESLRRKK